MTVYIVSYLHTVHLDGVKCLDPQYVFTNKSNAIDYIKQFNAVNANMPDEDDDGYPNLNKTVAVSECELIDGKLEYTKTEPEFMVVPVIKNPNNHA